MTRIGLACFGLISTTVRATSIHDIQGASHISPLNGQSVSAVPGVVTLVQSGSFFMQEPTPDGNDATSEGILVFTSSAPAVSVGDSVTVSGTVTEFRPGGASTKNLTTTEITSPIVNIQSTGNPLPPSVLIGVGGRIPPAQVIEDDATNVETNGVFDPSLDGIDFYESMEGMRVQINDAVAVGPTAQFGATAELYLVGDNGAQAGLRSARGGLMVTATDFNPERITIENATANIPDTKVGDFFNGPITGIMDYNFGSFRVRPTADLPSLTTSSLPKGSTTLTASAMRLTVATLNASNLQPGDPQSKFDGLAATIVSNMASPSIICADEVQDNNGTLNDGEVNANTTLDKLVLAITTAGGPAYSYRQINPVNNSDGGQPGGNGRQVILYEPGIVTFVDRPGGSSTAGNSVVLNGNGEPELAYSPGRVDPSNSAFSNIRKPLAAEFMFRGQKVFLIANHFNSKGSDDPLFGRFQPPVLSSETQRMQCVQVITNFVKTIFAADPSARVVVAGNLNDFEFSNPLNTLKTAPLTNLVERLAANNRYTFTLAGNSESFHHILVSPRLASNSVIEVVHVSSEYGISNRFSDYDPLVALILTAPTNFTQWQSFYFDAQELTNVLVSGFTADPDNDRKANGLEAALGSDPRSSSENAGTVTAAIVGTGAARKLAMFFEMPSVALSDLTLTVEESTSLATNSWTAIATRVGAGAWSGTATVTVTPISADKVQVQVQSPQDISTPRTFLRLKVTR